MFHFVSFRFVSSFFCFKSFFFSTFVYSFLGAPNTFKIQARDKFDNDVKKGGAKLDGVVKEPNGKQIPVKCMTKSP
jgi:hypothetical protein